MLATSISSPHRHAGPSVQPGSSKRSNADIDPPNAEKRPCIYCNAQDHLLFDWRAANSGESAPRNSAGPDERLSYRGRGRRKSRPAAVTTAGTAGSRRPAIRWAQCCGLTSNAGSLAMLAAMRRAFFLAALRGTRSCHLSIIDRTSRSARSRGPVTTLLAPSMPAG
jgi:hypothetical protein